MGYVVLLRRINVTGGHVKMADLLATFRTVGYPAATSVLASGNIIVGSAERPDRDVLIEAIAQRHGIVTNAFIRSGTELRSVLDRCPFGTEDATIDVVFMHADLGAAATSQLADVAIGPDELVADGSEIYWRRPHPLGVSVPSERVLRSVIGGDSTRRTLRTVQRIAAKMEMDV